MSKFLFIPILLTALASTACQSVPMQTNCHTHVRFGDVLKGKPIKDSDFRINCNARP